LHYELKFCLNNSIKRDSQSLTFLSSEFAHMPTPQFDYISIGFYTIECLGWPFTAAPEGGGCNLIDEFLLAVSGAAGVAAIAAAKMGLKTRAIGSLGQDVMGDWEMSRLIDFKVDTRTMQREAGCKTSSSIVTARRDGSRPALHVKGATGIFTVNPKDFDKATNARV
jgi:pfkB family carbohydrate kinase